MNVTLQERKIVRAELLQLLQNMDYAAFEQVMKRLLYKSGYVTVQFIGRNHKRGRTPKGGLDLTARSITDLSSVLTIVQIKQYQRVVSRRFVDELRGAMLRLGAEQGLLVTLSKFSKVAHAAAVESNVAPIKLIEGREVLDLLFTYRIGVIEENDRWIIDTVYLDKLRGTSGSTSAKALVRKETVTHDSSTKVLLPKSPFSENNPSNNEREGMTWSTHIMAGICSLWIFELIPAAHMEHIAIYAGAAALGALLPDIDAPRSKIGQWSVGGIKPFFLPSQAINRSAGHRSISHSLLALVFIAGVGLVLSPIVGWQVSLALWLGYASHLLTDASTRSGIPLLYPRPRRFHLLPKPLRIVTGSAAEEIIFVAFAALVLILLLSNFSTLSI
jgi:inner membrane protein